MNIIIPITALSPWDREGEPQRPLALVPVRGKPLIGWVLEGLGELVAEARGVLFAVRAEHEDWLDLTGQLRPLVGRQPGVIVLDRAPRGELATVLKVRGAFDGDQELIVARGDRVVRSGLLEYIRIVRSSGGINPVRGIASVIGQPGDPVSVVRAEIDGGVRKVTARDALVPLLPTGLCYFSKAGEFLEAADAIVRGGASPDAEPVESYNEYAARNWPVQMSLAQEVWRPVNARPGRLTFASLE